MNQQDPRMRARNLTLWPRPLLTALVAAYTAMSLSAAAAVHTGEDGLEYAVGQSVDRSEWLHGKVEPDVTMAAATQKDVNVAVYVARPAPQARSLDPIEEIKARYRPQFDDIGGQMREIWRGARPSKSMSEEEERDFIKTRGMALSRADEDAVRALQREHDDLRTAMHKEIGRTLEATGAAERDQVANLVARLGGSVHAHIAVTNALAATVPATALDELAKNPLVVTVALDLETQLELDNSTDSAGFDSWHVAADGPFMGGAYDVGLIDTGVQQDHGGFSNVNSFHSNFAGTDSDSHGTHVAGIVANNSTTYVYGGPYPGTATDLDAMIWGRSSNSQATTMARMDDLMTDFAQSPEVVNHSLGYSSTGGVPSGPVSTNDYVSNDSFYDAFVRNYDVQVTKSAGNSGWGANATMTFPANAYNIMVVANMNDRNTLTRGDDVRSTSSSVGPTANGRRKPDISAPGTSIISTNAFWNTGIGSNPTGGCAGNGTDMCTKSGTSMAAPHIAGAIVLQHDGGNIDSQAQKAVLLNTADWWDSNDTSSTADDGQRFAQTCAGGFDPCETPWDRSYGWGYVDMAEALFNRSDYFVDSVVPNNNNAIENDYELYKGTMFTNEKATLVWEKRADTYVAGGTAGGQRTLSDLNIRLYAGADGRLMDGDFQGNDNVHQVAADEFGTAVIKVYAWSSVFDGASSETFWLATEENFERTNPPSFSATPLIPVVGPFQTFTAPTIVANNGGVPAHNVNVAIANVAGVAGDGTSQNVGTISDGASEQVDFTITTQGLSAGIYNIPVTVTSTSYDETYTGTSITGVQISVETTPPSSTCAALPADTNGNSINIPWSGSDGIFGTGMGSATLYVVTPGGGGYVSTGLTQNGSSGTFNYNFAAGDGPYRFAVRATDNGGNQEAFPVVADCATSVDRVTPESMASAPQFVAAGTIPISWSWTDAAPSSGLDALDIVYAVAPDGAWQDTGFVTDQANGVHNWAPPGPGVYRFATRSEDKAGNSESAPDVSDFDASTVYAGSDSDGDGVLDEDDNCTQVPNADQRDTNGDGYGNLCDADLDNNGIVNPVDLGLFRSVFFTADADADFDGDGVVNAVDLGIIKASFFLPPGPSGVAP